MRKGDRPEHTAPPEIFYNEDEARKYTSNTRMIDIQSKITARAMELLAIPKDGVPRMLLDLGCGSGLSGEAISEEGHTWIGMDISEAMLDVAKEREVEGDVCLADLGHGLAVRQGVFDGAISISAVQWLCNADKTCNVPRKRIRSFFDSLYKCLAKGGRAVLQIYPENATQADMLLTAAMKAGFSGGLLVDYPHSTRAKKYYMVLMIGTGAMPRAKGVDGGEGSEDEEEEGREGVRVNGRKTKKRGREEESKVDWVVRKKEQMRKRGYENIPLDTKYTARKRGPKF